MAESEFGSARQPSSSGEQTPNGELQRRLEEARDSIAQTVTEIKETVGAQVDAVLMATNPQLDDSFDEIELRALIDESLAIVEQAREKIKREQVEIDRLKSETRMMISRLLAA